MNLIEVLRSRACDRRLSEADMAVDLALYLLADLRQHYRTFGERGLVSAINDLTEAAFAYVPRNVPTPEPLVLHSVAGRIDEALRAKTPDIINTALGTHRSADVRVEVGQ